MKTNTRTRAIAAFIAAAFATMTPTWADRVAAGTVVTPSGGAVTSTGYCGSAGSFIAYFGYDIDYVATYKYDYWSGTYLTTNWEPFRSNALDDSYVFPQGTTADRWYAVYIAFADWNYATGRWDIVGEWLTFNGGYWCYGL